jgi:hypothetical protein
LACATVTAVVCGLSGILLACLAGGLSPPRSNGEGIGWKGYKKTSKDEAVEVLPTGHQTPVVAWQLGGLNLCN